MPRSKTKPDVRELLTVFDTNALWTQNPGDLINADMRTLVTSNSAHADLKISWHLPEPVVRERHYQMKGKATALLKNFEKMETLLNLQIKLTPEDLDQKIAKVIDDQMAALDLRRAPVNESLVDWKQVMENAAFRVAPFESGETEKGFRDSLILESFCQLVASAPRAPDRCRAVLITNDKLLTEAAELRIKDYANAQVLPDLSALRNLINTLVSTVDEAFVAGLREKAGKIFFDGMENKESLYLKEDITGQIREKFKQEFSALPTGAESRSTNSIRIATPPEFLKKDGQRVFWSTKITYKVAASRIEYNSVEPQQSLFAANTSGLGGAAITLPSGVSVVGSMSPFVLGTSNVAPQFNTSPYVSGVYSPNVYGTSGNPAELLRIPKSVVVRTGKTVFEVVWSAHVNQAKKLSKLKIEQINFIETTWD
jgi:hypothetical protein